MGHFLFKKQKLEIGKFEQIFFLDKKKNTKSGVTSFSVNMVCFGGGGAGIKK